MRSRPGGSAARLFRSRSDCRSGHRLTVPAARYRYDSLQLFTERRFADLPGVGLFTFQLAFTFSKSFESNHRLNSWNLEEVDLDQKLRDAKTASQQPSSQMPNGVTRFQQQK